MLFKSDATRVPFHSTKHIYSFLVNKTAFLRVYERQKRIIKNIYILLEFIRVMAQGAEESNSTKISVKFTVSMHRRSILLFKAPHVTSVLI